MSSLEYTGAFDADKYECTRMNPTLAELIKEKIAAILKNKHIIATSFKIRVASGNEDYEIVFKKG